MLDILRDIIIFYFSPSSFYDGVAWNCEKNHHNFSLQPLNRQTRVLSAASSNLETAFLLGKRANNLPEWEVFSLEKQIKWELIFGCDR